MGCIFRGVGDKKPDISILVVNNSPRFLSTIKTMLIKKGYNVDVTSQPDQAIDNMQERSLLSRNYSTMIIGCRTPTYNEAERVVKYAAGHEIGTIVIPETGLTVEGQKLIQAGADAMVHRPIQAEELLTAIAKYIQ